MGMWQIAGRGTYYDDGLKLRPGEPGFSTAKVKAVAKDAEYNYVGTPNVDPPAEEEPAPAGE